MQLPRVSHLVSVLVALASRASADAGTSWLAPVDGAFNDPARWSSGAPNTQTSALFGPSLTAPFTVSLGRAQACTVLLAFAPSCTLDGGTVPRAELFAEVTTIHGPTLASLTLRNCTYTNYNAFTLGATGENGALHVGDGATLNVGNSLWAGIESVIDFAPSASVSAKYLGGGTLRWTIDDGAACFVNVSAIADFSGAIRIAFGLSGPPAPGAVVSLCTDPDTCATITGTVIVESNGRAIDGVVAIENDVLVYRQLLAPLQLIVDVPPMPAPGFVSLITTTGFGDGRTFELSRQATLSSSDERVIQVIGPERVLAVAPGRATLTATLGSSSSSVSVTVGDEPLHFSVIDNESCSWTELGGMSHDGRFVTFDTAASSLTPNDTNGEYDVFVRDLATGAIERVSEGANGEQGSNDSYDAAISGDGRFVVFFTESPEFVGVANVLVLKDRLTGSAEIVSVKPDGTPDLNVVGDAHLSFDGRFVAFNSQSPELAPGLIGFAPRAFVRDRVSETTTLVGIGPDGTALPTSVPGAFSSDGRFVALLTVIEGPGDALMVRDLVAGITTLEIPTDISNAALTPIAMSDDGRFVVVPMFHTYHPQLALRDRLAGTTTFITTREDIVDGVEVAMSANGRYVAFHAERFLPCEPYYLNGFDAWRYDLVLGTKQRINDRAGGPPFGDTGFGLALSADGRFCAMGGFFDDLMPIDQPCISLLRRRFGPINGADINGDGAVNASDLALLIEAWGSSDEGADLDGDGLVGPTDLATLLAAWTNN